MPRLFQRPEQTQCIARQMAEQLTGKLPDLVVGVGEGSVILAYELARQMDARCLHALRHNGTMTVRREFDVTPGERALIVEDVVSTGKSIRETVELLRALNVSILGISAIGPVKFFL
ncbi:MAG: phosphoribosyltransferase family protein [Candidatus Ventricola sp.]